jgi:hypothetical protein
MRNPVRQRRAALVDQMLHFFAEPRFSLGLHLQPEFAEYSVKEVRTMLYALDRVGLIANVAGGQTRASVYHLTAKGRWLLEMGKQ